MADSLHNKLHPKSWNNSITNGPSHSASNSGSYTAGRYRTQKKETKKMIVTRSTAVEPVNLIFDSKSALKSYSNSPYSVLQIINRHQSGSDKTKEGRRQQLQGDWLPTRQQQKRQGKYRNIATKFSSSSITPLTSIFGPGRLGVSSSPTSITTDADVLPPPPLETHEPQQEEATEQDDGLQEVKKTVETQTHESSFDSIISPRRASSSEVSGANTTNEEHDLNVKNDGPLEVKEEEHVQEMEEIVESAGDENIVAAPQGSDQLTIIAPEEEEEEEEFEGQTEEEKATPLPQLLAETGKDKEAPEQVELQEKEEDEEGPGRQELERISHIQRLLEEKIEARSFARNYLSDLQEEVLQEVREVESTSRSVVEDSGLKLPPSLDNLVRPAADNAPITGEDNDDGLEEQQQEQVEEQVVEEQKEQVEERVVEEQEEERVEEYQQQEQQHEEEEEQEEVEERVVEEQEEQVVEEQEEQVEERVVEEQQQQEEYQEQEEESDAVDEAGFHHQEALSQAQNVHQSKEAREPHEEMEEQEMLQEEGEEEASFLNVQAYQQQPDYPQEFDHDKHMSYTNGEDNDVEDPNEHPEDDVMDSNGSEVMVECNDVSNEGANGGSTD